MSTIQKSFRQSFECLPQVRILLLALVPPLISFFVLVMVFVAFWHNWVDGLSSFFSGMTVFQWMEGLTGLQSFSSWVAMLFVLLAFVPLFYLFSVFLTSVFIMPVVLRWVADVEFKHLEKRHGGSFVGSIWNALFATVLFIFVFFVTCPLWLLPGCQILVPLFLTAWLNKKVFLYDVLQDYASKEERKRIEKEEGHSLYVMGMLLGLLSYVPLAFFFIPVLAALCYTYFGLNALSERRN